ncbi:aminodeoxychorismate synthase component I [Dongia sedimenti]|uniref:aminodeoxychorismate synthase n=1 Tax=Dongia sedimenti TaxID=3064282 RepID=A0ABU0YMF7_9PROT|nr:aminodeoxychorismate synthase component I [Rhodospirillaceae bacterium R-7]
MAWRELLITEIPAQRIPTDLMDWVAGFVDCPGLVFLDSALPHETLGRYSFIAADPLHRLVTRGDSTTIDGAPFAGSPFDAIDHLLARYPLNQVPGLPPFQTGLAGQFGYGLRRYIETVPAHASSDHGFPDLELGWYDTVLAVDHQERRAFVFASGDRAEARIEWALARLDRKTQVAPPDWEIEPEPDLSADQYRRAVRRTIDYIEAGDIYQANITQRFQAALPQGFDRLALYDALRRRNPATFAAFIDFGETALLSSSPERFLKIEGGAIETRPIKGTRPRGGSPAHDAALARELLASEKDRAENLMIVDLLRNDLGRVAKLGSVRVPVLIGLESYATVHHLVSVVTAALDDGKTAVDLLRAAFPGGSVTGAPKIRAMEIIAELEPTERGPYCGAIGYLSAGGAMDTNIVIRTLLIDGARISFQVGGGIVADSDPQAEWEESLTKAKALIETLAGRGQRAAKKSA